MAPMTKPHPTDPVCLIAADLPEVVAAEDADPLPLAVPDPVTVIWAALEYPARVEVTTAEVVEIEEFEPDSTV